MVTPMAVTTKVDAPASRGDAPVRLRVDVYDALAAAKGYKTVEAQATWHGLNRATLFDLRAGKTSPLLATAMGIAADLGVAVEVVWERLP
jgi:DNA-binding XRE family transcriptional regulator